jgi:hypothetical protein
MPKRTLLNIPPKQKSYGTVARNAAPWARLMDTEENAARYLRMADAYHALAEQEEQLESNVARFNLKR